MRLEDPLASRHHWHVRNVWLHSDFKTTTACRDAREK